MRHGKPFAGFKSSQDEVKPMSFGRLRFRQVLGEFMIKSIFFVALFALTAIAQAKDANLISGRDLIQVTGLACDSVSLARLTRWAAKTDIYYESVPMDGIKVADGQVRAKKHAIKIEQKDGRFIMSAGGRKVTGQNVCDLVVNFAESEANEKVSVLSLLVPSAHAENVLDQAAAAANATANASPVAASNASSNSAVAAPAEVVAAPAAPTSTSASTSASPVAETVAAPASAPVQAAPSGPEMVAGQSGAIPSNQLTLGTVKPVEGPMGSGGTNSSGGRNLPQTRNQTATAQALAAAAAAVAGGVAQPNQGAVPAVVSQLPANGSAITAAQLQSLLASLAGDDIKVKCSKKKATIRIAGKRIVINKKKDTVKVLPKRKNSQEIPNKAELIAMAKTCDNKAEAKTMEAQFKALLTGTNVAVEQSIAAAAKTEQRGLASVDPGAGAAKAGNANRAQ
jgi:hypothetical protein